MYDREQYVHNLNQKKKKRDQKRSQKRSQKHSLMDPGYLFSELKESEWLNEWLSNYLKMSVDERKFGMIMGFNEDLIFGFRRRISIKYQKII